MDRETRRARTERWKRRRLAMIYNRACGPSFAPFERLDARGRPFSELLNTWWWPDSIFMEKPWRYAQNVKLMTMREYGPRSWTHPMMTRPARGRQNQMLRARDFEGAFPDYRKPKKYCW